MNLLLFLNTSYVTADYSDLSLVKDIGVPLFSALLGAGAAYLVMLGQSKNQRELEIEKERMKNEGIMNFYKFNVSEIIKDNEIIQGDIENEFNTKNSEDINYYPSRAKVQLPNLELILNSNLESHFIAFLSDKNILIDFNKSFRALMRLKRLLDAINTFIDEYTIIYNETNDKINDTFLRITYHSKYNNMDPYINSILKKHSLIPLNSPKYYLNVFTDIKSTIDHSHSEILNSSIEGLSQIRNLKEALSNLESGYKSFLDEYDSNIHLLKLISS